MTTQERLAELKAAAADRPTPMTLEQRVALLERCVKLMAATVAELCDLLEDTDNRAILALEEAERIRFDLG